MGYYLSIDYTSVWFIISLLTITSVWVIISLLPITPVWVILYLSKISVPIEAHGLFIISIAYTAAWVGCGCCTTASPTVRPSRVRSPWHRPRYSPYCAPVRLCYCRPVLIYTSLISRLSCSPSGCTRPIWALGWSTICSGTLRRSMNKVGVYTEWGNYK